MVYPGFSKPYELYYNWYFGYELYTPKSITLDGFTCGTAGEFFVYPEIENTVFINEYKHCHHLTEKIVYKNMAVIPKITPSDNSTALWGIPVSVE